MSYETLEAAVRSLTTTNAALVSAVTGTQQEASLAITVAQESATAAGNSKTAAQESAVLASQQATIASNKEVAASASAGLALTRANAAQASAATAAAVVTGGTASLTPAAGKIPLANGKGKISPDWFVVDQLRASVEAASGGRTTVIYTNEGNPSYMHILPAFNCEDVAPGGELGTGLHPAFMFDGVAASEIMVGAHLGGMMGSQVVSMPGLDPRAAINFDQARALCQANGAGWDIMSNLDWAAIALWCKANGYEPRGNTNWGRHHVDKWETGRRADKTAPGTATGTGRTRTGSGPAAWSHDGTPAGIHDLVGNVWEWVSGMKLQDGRVWLAEDNGKNVEAQYIDTGYDLSAGAFSTRPTVGASELVKQSLIAPATPSLAPTGTVYVTATGERIPCRGGRWHDAGLAGLGALHLNSERSYVSSGVGFRPRFRVL